MLSIFSVIGNFFGKIFSKDFLPVTLTVIISILVFINLNTCSRLKVEQETRKQEKEIYDQNFSAFVDTVTKIYNEQTKTFEYQKNMYLTTLNELSKYDSAFSDKLKKVKGDILNAIDSKISYNQKEPIVVDNKLEKYDNNRFGLRWSYYYSDLGLTQRIGGVTIFGFKNNTIFAGNTKIDTNYISLKITYGFREYNDKYKVWAISQSPLIKIDELSGAYFIDKPLPYTPITHYYHRWTIGPYIGADINFDYKLQNPRFGYSFGIGIQYHLFGFGKKPVKSKKTKKNNNIYDIDNYIKK